VHGRRTPTPAQIKAALLTQLAPSGASAKIVALVRNGGYSFSFRELSAGRVVIDWYYLPKGANINKPNHKPKAVLVATGNAKFSKAGQGKLSIKLIAAGGRMLKTAKSPKLTAKGTYILAGNPAVVATKAFTLKR
jgi:hypothetical protein